MNSTAVTDWWSAQQRAEAALAKAKKRREAAEYDVQQAERALEVIKMAQRRAVR